MGAEKIGEFMGERHQQLLGKVDGIRQAWFDMDLIGHELEMWDSVIHDNGAYVMQQLSTFNMQGTPGRQGNDAVSRSGVEWELKTIDRLADSHGFSTSTALSENILNRYKSAYWLFSVFRGTDMEFSYALSPTMMTPLLDRWEAQIRESGRGKINGPKIPLSFVEFTGVKVFDKDNGLLVDPEEALGIVNGEVRKWAVNL